MEETYEKRNYWLIEIYPSSWTYLLPEDSEFAFTVTEDGAVVSDYWNSGIEAVSISNDEQRLDVLKTDESGNLMEGAEFVLGAVWQTAAEYSVPVEGTDWNYKYLMLAVDDETGEYVPDDDTYSDERDSATRLVTGFDGRIHTRGLTTSTLYFLVETKAPDGYISLYQPENDAQITVSGTTITVADNAGRELPGTGGEGILPFMMAGFLLTGSAASILGRRKRFA